MKDQLTYTWTQDPNITTGPKMTRRILNLTASHICMTYI